MIAGILALFALGLLSVKITGTMLATQIFTPLYLTPTNFFPSQTQIAKPGTSIIRTVTPPTIQYPTSKPPVSVNPNIQTQTPPKTSPSLTTPQYNYNNTIPSSPTPTPTTTTTTQKNTISSPPTNNCQGEIIDSGGNKWTLDSASSPCCYKKEEKKTTEKRECNPDRSESNPISWRCKGGVATGSADRDWCENGKWINRPCPQGTICIYEVVNGKYQATCRKCDPGATRCNGTQIVQCSIDGTYKEEVKEDCREKRPTSMKCVQRTHNVAACTLPDACSKEGDVKAVDMSQHPLCKPYYGYFVCEKTQSGQMAWIFTRMCGAMSSNDLAKTKEEIENPGKCYHNEAYFPSYPQCKGIGFPYF